MRWIFLLLSLVLTAAIALAVGTGDFSAAGAWLVRDPWGRVTLIDLYAGFFLSAVVIAAYERKFWVSLFWIAPILVLGNVWTAIWFAWRARDLWARLTRA